MMMMMTMMISKTLIKMLWSFVDSDTFLLWHNQNKKDRYRQRNVRQFLQSAWHIIWLPDESHAGMTLPTALVRYSQGPNVPRLIAETDARYIGDSHPTCL